MTPQPARPFTPSDLARLRARHLADQAEARRAPQAGRRLDVVALVTAHVLLVAFGVTGCYALAAAAGLAPAVPGSALAG